MIDQPTNLTFDDLLASSTPPPPPIIPIEMSVSIAPVFDSTPIRIIGTPGQPLFVAKDVCFVLCIANSRDAITRLDDDEKGVAQIDTLGGTQSMAVITESGLYSLILRSDKPQAKPFRKWVTSEVLPEIRKTGSFSKAAPISLPSYAESLRQLANSLEKNAELEQKIEEQAPKVKIHDTLMESDTDCCMATAAQLVWFGQNRLFEKLRTMGVLISGGSRHNLPKQRYIELGLFNVKEWFYVKDRETIVTFTTTVTQKGVAFLIQNLGKKQKNS
jgi:anti-repressor protein